MPLLQFTSNVTVSPADLKKQDSARPLKRRLVLGNDGEYHMQVKRRRSNAPDVEKKKVMSPSVKSLYDWLLTLGVLAVIILIVTKVVAASQFILNE